MHPPANAGDLGSIFGSGRSSGEGNSHLLQYSCLENSMYRGVWQATVHGITTESATTEPLNNINFLSQMKASIFFFFLENNPFLETVFYEELTLLPFKQSTQIFFPIIIFALDSPLYSTQIYPSIQLLLLNTHYT